MYLEIIAFIGAIVLILVFFAETKKPILGLAASFILFILGYWVFTDGIQMQTGESLAETITLSGNSTISSTEVVSGNDTTTTGSTSFSENKTLFGNSTKIYEDIPATSITPLHEFLGVVFMLLSIFGMFNYTLTTIQQGV